MKKLRKILSLALLLGLSVGTQAMPAWRGTLTRVQPDGSVLRYQLVGDEHYHQMLTTDGYLLGADSKGTLHYATMSKSGAIKLSAMAAHDVDARTADEKSFLATTAPFDFKASRETAMKRLAAKNLALATNRLSVDPTLTKGKIRGIVILVEFADNSFQPQYDRDLFYRKMNESGFSEYQSTGSARDYFISQSDSLFQPTFDVVGPVKLSRNLQYYGQNSGGSDMHAADMVQEACTLAHDSLGVDFSQYDNNHDGTVDFVYVYYAGYAESYGAPSYTIWPHAANLKQLGYNFSFDGVDFDRYACSSELNMTTGTGLEGIGSFCHEFGHVLGLPDMYNTLYQSVAELGNWDIMCQGSYNNVSRTPPAYSAYERSTLGWLDLTTIDTPADSMTLGELNATHQAYRINTQGDNPDEYFILENRQQQGWDAYTPGKGMLIWHIAFNQTAWDNNTVNVGTPRIDIVEADGSASNGAATDTYPQPNNDMFTDYSSPNSLSRDGIPTEKGVTHIKDNDGIISFSFMRDRLARPKNVENAGTTSHSFVAKWDAVDNATSYSLTIKEQLKDSENPVLFDEDFSGMTDGTYPSSGSTDISETLDDYTKQPYWYGTNLRSAGGYVLIGQYGQGGQLSTPALKFDGSQPLTLSFKTVGYPGKNVGYTVTLYDVESGSDVETHSFKANRRETQNDIILHPTTGRYRIRFATTNERLFIDAIRIVKDSTGGDTVWTLGPKTWTIDSIKGTEYTVDSLVSGRTYIYSVVAEAPGQFMASMSSDEQTVTLPSTVDAISTISGTTARPVEVEYYDLSGRRVSPSTSGLLIRRTRYADGSTTADKLLRGER